jgi:DNA-binding GntR family transcriptional regulator
VQPQWRGMGGRGAPQAGSGRRVVRNMVRNPAFREFLEALRDTQDDLRGAIRIGALESGDPLPTVVELGERYDVSPATAYRAPALLADGGEVAVSRGRRAVVS